MKKIALILISLLSLSASASNCDPMTFTKEWIDYDSSWNGSCTKFLEEAMKAQGCDMTNFYISPIRLTEIQSGSELMCIYKGKTGVYQVMASQMAEPHRAVVMFSHWD